MDRSEDRRTQVLALVAGESKQLLVEAGTTLLLLSGNARLYGVPDGTVPGAGQRLLAEEAMVIDGGGWIGLVAAVPSQAVLIPPERTQFWRRVGDCLARLAHGTRAGTAD